jgi:hypothetical protein
MSAPPVLRDCYAFLQGYSAGRFGDAELVAYAAAHDYQPGLIWYRQQERRVTRDENA